MTPILVWGAGAIGGTVGAFLRSAGENVLFVDRVADHVETIRRLDIAAVPPTSHALPVADVLRPDVPGPCLTQDAALAAAPAAERGRFRVPRILGEAP